MAVDPCRTPTAAFIPTQGDSPEFRPSIELGALQARFITPQKHGFRTDALNTRHNARRIPDGIFLKDPDTLAGTFGFDASHCALNGCYKNTGKMRGRLRRGS